MIPFPSNRIVEKSTSGPSKKDQKFLDEMHKQQTREFVESSVDDMSMNLLKSFYNMGIKTDRGEFTKDLAMLVDTMRGLIYRDFNMKHPSQVLSEKMVELRTFKNGTSYEHIRNSLKQVNLFDDDFNECDSGYCGL